MKNKGLKSDGQQSHWYKQLCQQQTYSNSPKVEGQISVNGLAWRNRREKEEDKKKIVHHKTMQTHNINESERWIPSIQPVFSSLIYQSAYSKQPSLPKKNRPRYRLFLFPGVLELPSLSNPKAKPQAPLVNDRLRQWGGQSPKERMGPVRCATGLVPYPTQTCPGIFVCWWNK